MVTPPNPPTWSLQRIREGSVIDRIPVISVGDMIEAIDGQSLVGARHYEVAKMLKELPRGRTFALQLTEPRKAFGEPQLGALGTYWETWVGGCPLPCPRAAPLSWVWEGPSPPSWTGEWCLGLLGALGVLAVSGGGWGVVPLLGPLKPGEVKGTLETPQNGGGPHSPEGTVEI